MSSTANGEGVVRQVLVATDGSEFSAGAIRVGVALARSAGAQLNGLSVSVYEPEYMTLVPNLEEESAARAERALDALREAADGYHVKRLVRSASDPADGIVETASAIKADLIVMGRRGRRGLARMMLGHATAEVIGRAPMPVLVAPRAARLFERRILLATDASAHSEAAASTACRFALAFGLPVTVVSVLVSTHHAARRREGEQAVAATVDMLQRTGVAAEGRIEEGAAADGVVRAAEQTGADLIVMGSHGRTGLKRLLLGSVTERVIGEVACPVLIVKPAPIG